MPKRSTAIAATIAGALAIGLALVPAGADAAQVQTCANVQVPTAATQAWYDFANTPNPYASLHSDIATAVPQLTTITAGLNSSSSDDQISDAQNRVGVIEQGLQAVGYTSYSAIYGPTYTLLGVIAATGTSADINATEDELTGSLSDLSAAFTAYGNALGDLTDSLDDQFNASPFDGVDVPSATVLEALASDVADSTGAFFATGASHVVLQTVSKCSVLTVPDVAVTSSTTTFGTATSVATSVALGGALQSGPGTVLLDGQVLGTPQLSGVTGIPLPNTLSVGAHYVTVVYNSAAGVAPSSATGIVTVTKAATSTTVKLSKSSVKKGKSAKATVTVAAPGLALAPTGSVTLYVNGKKFATKTLKAGKATVALKTSKKGTQKVTVKYATSVNFAASSSKSTSLKIK